MAEFVQNREFAFTPEDFDLVRKILFANTGIKLADSKDSMVYGRLSRRLRQLKLTSFNQYLQFLDSTPEELEVFINGLTTNLTSFFREPHHFEVLTQFLKEQKGQIKIWCSASSTGEEPYSLAMTAVEAYGSMTPPVSILASDIDSSVLAKASEGIYEFDRINSMSKPRLKQFFYRGKGANAGKVKVVPELQKLIKFQKINLMDNKWPMQPPVNVIFCRNVMIYFDRQTQMAIFERMLALLPNGGLFVAGHSENFANSSPRLKALGHTVYKVIS
ncbi:CheR family methyltransferase [Neptunicella marina]|uniref:Chemotaxis protein methyltransferase n=1 Tax=Neptunicella marina TaxID=2125989 RepID=A0A8J6M1G2_9ALTE|nr:CheR family methyltransferase [Neptunicella marina]MBC3765458.1 chemotaxis protein CheR [Neptunicella marina]